MTGIDSFNSFRNSSRQTVLGPQELAALYSRGLVPPGVHPQITRLPDGRYQAKLFHQPAGTEPRELLTVTGEPSMGPLAVGMRALNTLEHPGAVSLMLQHIRFAKTQCSQALDNALRFSQQTAASIAARSRSFGTQARARFQSASRAVSDGP